MTIRKILPRRTLRDRDNTDGRYPTIARTGDAQRLGKFNVAFDDSNTHYTVSGSTVTVSYPTSLRVDSPLLEHDMTSSITAAGRIDRGTVEVWQRATKQVGTFVPFKEVGLHEQDGDKSDEYFLTGSDPGDIGFGLQGRLDAKTALRLELPIQHETHLDPHTASVYYYNTCGFFEEINPSGKCAINPFYSNVVWSTYDSTNHLDVKFFDPLGNYAISGTKYALNRDGWSDGGTDALDYWYQNLSMDTGAAQSMGIREAESVLVNPLYAANVTQSIDVGSLVTSPFVVERIEIEMPFKAGPGWLRDCTTMAVPEFTLGNGPHIGGPGITVALSNQITTTRRELIASATLFPEKDLHPWFEIPKWGIGAFNPLNSEITPMYNYRLMNGASAMGVKPTVVIGNTGDIQYTGSLRFTMEPRISNGVVVKRDFNILVYSAPAPDYDTNVWQKSIPAFPTNVEGSPLTINPFGRAGFGDVSGRSIFGRERSLPVPRGIPPQTYLDLKYLPYASDGLSGSSEAGVRYDLLVYNQQASAYSPYVIMPGDQLILSVSKYRPAWKSDPYQSGSKLAVTASHDASIPQGVIRMTIYGSHLRGGSEFHDTLNTPLTSDAVHEAINYEPVLDQFNGAARSLRSGSYLDHIITGSYTLSNGITMRGSIGSRAAISSTLHTDVRKSMRERKAYEFGGTNLIFAQASSPNERYWDTLLPAIAEVFEVDGGTFYSIEGGSYGKSGYAFGLLDYTFAPGDAQIPDNHITREFPFGPRYSSLTRRLEQDRPRVNKIYDFNVPGWVTRTPDQMLARSYMLHPTFPTSTTFKSRGAFPFIDWNVMEMTGTYGGPLDTPLARPPLVSDVIKFFFGFGDFNNLTQNSTNTSTVGTVLGTTTMPTLQYLDGLVISGEQDQYKTGHYMPIIRGWKYGVMNGLPQYSKAVYRNDHYGQLRDMLEQRVFGTFYETVGYKSDGTLGGTTGKVTGPVTVRFVARDGTSVDPSRTESCNLNSEATSSLPFFDGELRNRLPIDETKLGGELVAPLVL